MTPNALGIIIYNQFCDERNDAVFSKIKKMVKEEANLDPAIYEDEGVGVVGAIAGVWGIKDTNHLISKLGKIAEIPERNLGTTNNWKSTLRVAQCAAMAGLRINANLVPLRSIAEDPHVIAVDTICNLGQRAISLLAGVIDTKFLTDNNRSALGWDAENKDKVEQLGFKPDMFIKAMTTFYGSVKPENRPNLLNNGPHVYMGAFYRASTAAAVVGQGIHIDFVPFCNHN